MSQMTTLPVLPAAERGRSLEELLDPALFRVLGDETRLKVLGRLATSVDCLTVTEVADCCGVHLSGVSRHLRALHDAGLVSAERQGREVRYRLRCAALSRVLRGLADALDRCAASCGDLRGGGERPAAGDVCRAADGTAETRN